MPESTDPYDVVSTTIHALLDEEERTLDAVESAVADLTWGLKRFLDEGHSLNGRLSRALKTLDDLLVVHDRTATFPDLG